MNDVVEIEIWPAEAAGEHEGLKGGEGSLERCALGVTFPARLGRT